MAVETAEYRPNLLAGTYRIVASALNVRTGTGTGYVSVAKYSRGQIVSLDGWCANADGCV